MPWGGRRRAESEPSVDGPRNLVILTMDSLRFDSFLAADTKRITRIAPVEQRWSYAPWTAPSHYNLMMGLLPHTSPPHVSASEYYKQDYLRYSERLGTHDTEFQTLVPSLSLPTYLRTKLGSRTHAMVSMPVLNPATPINRDFDSYTLMPKHNDMAAMLDQMTFTDEQPSFYLLNVGETHYPYALPDEDPSEWPRISGVHGVFKRLDDDREHADHDAPAFFDDVSLRELHGRQIDAVSYLDGVFAKLFDRLPSGTWGIVTSDHGELFGEQRYFGHGPISHEKVFEVPFVEGVVP